MLLHFTKMHGLGNDFMVIDNLAGDIALSATQIIALSDRHFGVGFDQLLLVEPSTTAGVDFNYVIYNADGSQAQQCGNGARCFARFVSQKGLTKNNPINVQTGTNQMSLLINDDSSVQVNMGEPHFRPEDIPLLANQANSYQIAGYQVGILSMGNPHCVMLVDEADPLNSLDIATIAQKIQQSSLLPEQANVGFMQILNRGEIKLRVYERGVGETLACGSGACAAVVYGVSIGLLDAKVLAHLNGGDGRIEYIDTGAVLLSASAEFVFEGEVVI